MLNRACTGWESRWYKPAWGTLSTFFFAALAWLFTPRFFIPAVQMYFTALLMVSSGDEENLIYGLSWWIALMGIAWSLRNGNAVRTPSRRPRFEGKSRHGHCAGLHSCATFRRVALPDLRGRSGVGVASTNGPDAAGRGRQDSCRRRSRPLMTRLARLIFKRTDCHGPHLIGNRSCTNRILLEWRHFEIS